MEATKTITPVAHDNRKKDLIEWFEYNYQSLVRHKLVCTEITGRLIEEAPSWLNEGTPFAAFRW